MFARRRAGAREFCLEGFRGAVQRLCGAEGFVDFAEFGQAESEFLRSFLELPNGLPSHAPFRGVFVLLDPAQFAACLRHWTESLRQSIGAEIDARRPPAGCLRPSVSLRSVVALDGKTLRGSHDRAKGKEPIDIVSGWARENPGQRRTRLRDPADESAQRVESVYRQEPEPGDDRDDEPSLK